MSMRAAGNVAGTISYRQQRGQATAQYARPPQKAATPRQIKRRTTFAAAAALWNSLDAIDRLPWHREAYKIGTTGRKLFVREYILQQISGGSMPLLPTTHGGE